MMHTDIRSPIKIGGRALLGMRQIQVYWYIDQYRHAHGAKPSLRSIEGATGIDGRGNVSRIVKSLRRRGML